MSPGPIRIAVPNKGRLQEPTLRLLKDAGLSFEVSDRSLAARVRNADLELLFVRAEDIPELVIDGVARLGITGRDLLAELAHESEHELEMLLDLGFGRCRLAAAVPQGSPLDKIEDLKGLKVATSHPKVVRTFFDDRGIEIGVVPLRGSIEVAPRLGVADAVVDLVSTGSTLIVNGLREIGTILHSEAVLIARKGAGNGEAERMATALRAVVAARGKRYILLNAPEGSIDRIATLIPGLEAPTVVPLAEEGWVAMHSVVDADDVWRLLPALSDAGGKGILVLPIDQVLA